MVLSPTLAAVAAGGIVLVVIILWKLLKLAFRVAIIIAAVLAIFYVARQAGWL